MSSLHPIPEIARGYSATEIARGDSRVPTVEHVGGQHGFPCGFDRQWPLASLRFLSSACPLRNESSSPTRPLGSITS